MVRSFFRCHTLTTSVNVCDKVQSAQLYSKTGNIRQENIHSLEFRLWHFHGMPANARFAADTLAAMSSAVPRQRRLLWFGHVVREGEESSSFQALLMSINTTDIRRPRGRPRLRWIDVVKKDLQCINLSLLDAVQSASDRAAWLEIVNRCVDLMQ